MLKQIIEKEGPVTLLQGMGPTLSGYALQGGLKYGFYEIFKQIIKFLMHENDFYIDRILMFMIAGGLAETIGTSVLTPFEAARIRLVSNPSYASGIATCITKMIAEDGFGSLYAGLIPIMLKQVPFTILQLSSFEYLTSTIYSKLYDNGA